VDVGVLMLKSKQKKVTANMVTLNFRTFPKVTILDGLTPVPKARLKVINPLANEQEVKGLILLTTKSGETCGYNQILLKKSNENQVSPSSKASLAMSSPSQ